jgi:hypothetical protein
MLPTSERDQWVIFEENREAVVAALRRGECEAILPAARTFLDGFTEFLHRHEILEQFGDFPDHRARGSIPAFFFCVTLLHLPLFRLHRLVDIEGVLFRSPFILRLLGFNARQIAQGFYATTGPRPFTAEALGDFFAEVPPETLLEQQLVLLGHLHQQFPEVFRHGVYAMDCMTVAAPPGRLGLPAARFVLCILSVHLGPTALPILWSYAPEVGEGTGDISLGRTLVARARDVLTPADLSLLLIDRGFLDGAWLAEQARLGTDIIIGLKEDMLAYADLVGLSRLADTVWEDVPPPKNHRAPPPVRQVALFPPIDSWEACDIPLTGLVVRDCYPTGEVVYQAYVSPRAFPNGGSFYREQRRRWDAEECYMTLARYWGVNGLPPMRLGVAHAVVHFALVAYLLLCLFRWKTQAEGPLASLPRSLIPEVELAVYAGNAYALLTASEILTIVLSHAQTWRRNRSTILAALRLSERRLDTS